MTTIGSLLAAYRDFRKNLASTDLKVRTRTTFRPLTAEQRVSLEGRRGKLPAELAELLSTSFENVSIESADDSRLFAAAVFLDAKGILSGLDTADRVAADLESVEPSLAELLRRAIPLQEDSNAWYLDTADGSVWKLNFDGEPFPKVAGDFATAFEHWLEAGCFDCGNADVELFEEYWAKVRGMVPGRIAPEENQWLRALATYYGNSAFPTGKKAGPKKKATRR
jgi:hypothetical protein